MIHYRPLETAEYTAASDLTVRVWQMDARNVPSPYVLHVAVHTGGCLIGAFDDDNTNLIGYVLGFASQDGRLWSHIAAVDPAYQRRGIGYELKQKQYEWARQQGYWRISWTYDPLLRRNANFNFNYLSVISTTYHVNFYGVMPDGLNANFESDRLEVDWDIQDDDTSKAADDRTAPADTTDDTEIPFILAANSDAAPQVCTLPADVNICRLMIPYDIPAMKANRRSLAQAWQLAIRQQFTTAFAAGFTVTGFHQTDDQCWYLLTR